MTEPFLAFEKPLHAVIYNKRERRSCDALHDPHNKLLREPQADQNSLEEVPINRIKSLTNVDFDHAAGRNPFSVILSKHLSGKMNVLNQASPFNKGCFSTISDGIHNGGQSRCQILEMTL